MISLTLDSGFVQQTEDYIKEIIEMYKTARVSPRLYEIWERRNAGDFLCGLIVGQMIGVTTAAFQSKFGRESTPEEDTEIVVLVEKHAKEIKAFCDAV